MMVNVPFAVLAAESVAEHVTVVVAIANVESDAGEQVVGIAPSTASVAVGAVQETAAPLALVASTTLFAGTPVSTGARSMTSILKVPVVKRLALSVAVQLTVVVPMAKVDPDGGRSEERRVGKECRL